MSRLREALRPVVFVTVAVMTLHLLDDAVWHARSPGGSWRLRRTRTGS